MVEAFAKGLLEETREEITRADTKASILLASIGVAAAVLTGAVASGDIRFAGVTGIVQALSVAAALALSAGLGLLGAAVWPHTGKPESGRARYFMEHAQYETPALLSRALERESGERAERHLTQLLALSKIVKQKYRLTQAGEASTGLGIVLAGLAAVLHQIS